MLKYLITVFLYCFCLLTFGQTATVQLTVTDYSNTGITGATVKLIPTGTNKITGKDGSVQFSSLQKGQYKMAISFTGLETKRISFTVTGDTLLVLEPVVVNFCVLLYPLPHCVKP
jgi:hypothetical protein